MTSGDHDDRDGFGFEDDLEDHEFGDEHEHRDGDPWGSGDPLGRLRDLTADDPRVQAGVDHLQRAAREVIAASRALLDVADDLVEDPRALGGLVGLLGSVGDLAGRLGRAAGAPGAASGGASRDADGDDGEGDEPPVQRIPVS